MNQVWIIIQKTTFVTTALNGQTTKLSTVSMRHKETPPEWDTVIFGGSQLFPSCSICYEKF
jgi:hypothetical protein